MKALKSILFHAVTVEEYVTLAVYYHTGMLIIKKGQLVFREELETAVFNAFQDNSDRRFLRSAARVGGA